MQRGKNAPYLTSTTVDNCATTNIKPFPHVTSDASFGLIQIVMLLV